MKSFLLLATLMAPVLAPAEDAPPLPPPTPPLIRVELLIVRLPENRALDLQPELRDPARVAAAQEKLLTMIKKKEAQLIDWPVLTTKSGNRAVVENIHEVRYPIGYEAPKVVAVPSENPDPQHVDKPEAPAPTVRAPEKSKPTPPADVKLGDRTIAGVPSVFETRNTGVVLEVEPNIADDGKTIDAQLGAQHVTLLGYRREKLEVEGKFAVVTEVPEFQTAKTSTNVTLPSGQPFLLSFQQLQRPEHTVELFLLKMTALPAGRPAK